MKKDVYKIIKKDKLARIMVSLPTGAGKSVLAASIAKDVVESGGEVLVLAPLSVLITQMYTTFTSYGIDCGIPMESYDKQKDSAPVQIATLQTLAAMFRRNPIKAKEFVKNMYVIQDEGHLRFEAMDLISEVCTKNIISMSATPFTVGLGKKFGYFVKGPSVRYLIDAEYLSPFVAYSPSFISLKDVRSGRDGDYSANDVGDKYSKRILGECVRHWERLAGRNKQTIVFTPRVVDAERFCLEFQAKNYVAKAVSGYMDSDETADAIKDFKAGKINVLLSVTMLATGLDAEVDCIVDLAATKSLSRHIQKLGRGLRTYKGLDRVFNELLDLDHKETVFVYPSHVDLPELKKQVAERCEGDVLEFLDLDSATELDIVLVPESQADLIPDRFRIFRKVKPNKHHVIILDNAGNLCRNGFPDDPFPEKLDDGEKDSERLDRKKQEEPLPQPCPKCSKVKPPKTPICPSCGFKPEKRSVLDLESGELVPVTIDHDKLHKELTESGFKMSVDGDKLFVKPSVKLTKEQREDIIDGKSGLIGVLKKQQKELQRRDSYYQMLKGYRTQKGKPVDAVKMYTQKFKEKPRNPTAEGIKPDAEVARYVKSRFIANAKRKGYGRR